MVNNEIVNLIQNTADSFINSNGANYKAIYNGYTCVIHNEINYNFKKGEKKKIEANVIFGSAQKNNDLEDKYTMSFVINIQSEINGGELAKSLFDDVFKVLTRTYHKLGSYNSKVFLTSPTLMNPYYEIEDSFCCLYTMNGSVEFSEKIVLGSKYELSLNGVDFIEVKPRQPYFLKEAIGGMDKKPSNPSLEVFTKSSNGLSVNLVLIYQQIVKTTLTTAETNFNNLYNALLNECYGASSQSYTLKTTTGSVVKITSDLICVRGNHVYDETTGENVLSIQLKVGA